MNIFFLKYYYYYETFIKKLIKHNVGVIGPNAHIYVYIGLGAQYENVRQSEDE